MFSELLLVLSGIAGVSGGVWLGHHITMRAFADIQTSVREMALQLRGNTQIEPDPWSTTYEPVISTGKTTEEILEEIKRKTGVEAKDLFGVPQ
jgi:hypothetical protein